MKNIFRIVSILFIIWVWLFPVFISVWTGNWWLLFTYIVWWIPASLVTGILFAVDDHL